MQPWPVVGVLLVVTPLWRLADLHAQPGPVLVLGALGCIAGWVAGKDGWLLALLAYLLGHAALLPNDVALPTITIIVLGLVLYAVVRDMPAPAVRWCELALLAGGGVQIALVVFHALTGAGIPGGSLGNANYLAAYLALSVPVVPTPWLPAWAIGIVLAQSALGGLAFLAAILVRFRAHWRVALPAALITGAGVLWRRGLDLRSWRFRYAIWRAALVKIGQRPILGYGVGSWALWTPQANGWGATEIFGTAHNEYLQGLYEFGILGVLLVGCWLWRHRRALAAAPYGSGMVALAVECVAMFPFHIAAVALPALVLLGLATRRS